MQIFGYLGVLSAPVAGVALVAAVAAGIGAAGRVAAGPGDREAEGRTPVVAAGIVAVILATTLFLTLVSPPNTSDAMSYHVPRVLHWLDRGTLQPYFTGIDRQLWQPPFAEYLVAGGYGMAGGREWLINLPQWFAFGGVILAVMATARLLGADRRGRWLAAVLVATLPPAILQASSAQNDLLATFWTLVVVYLALRRLADLPPLLGSDAVLIGVAAALAVGTKGTALLFAVPWLAVFLWAGARTVSWRTTARHAATVLAIVAVFNAGHWIANAAVFDTFLGPSSVQRLLRPESMSPPVLLSNLVANLTLHAGTPLEAVNAGFQSVVSGLNALLGVNGDAVYPFFGGFRIEPFSTHEDLGGAPLHLLLGMAGLIVAVLRWRRLGPAARTGVVAVGASWLLFAAAVRWQPYNARLQLPMFAAMAPFLALWLGRAGLRVQTGVVSLLVAVAVPALVANATRPLLPGLVLPEPGNRGSILAQERASAYFNDRPALEPSYRALAARILETGCDQVGLVAGYDSWEYPLWALTRSGGVRFTHVPAGREDPALCAVAALQPEPPATAGRLVWTDGVVALRQP